VLKLPAALAAGFTNFVAGLLAGPPGLHSKFGCVPNCFRTGVPDSVIRVSTGRVRFAEGFRSSAARLLTGNPGFFPVDPAALGEGGSKQKCGGQEQFHRVTPNKYTMEIAVRLQICLPEIFGSQPVNCRTI
jgi:hypothetical protein